MATNKKPVAKKKAAPKKKAATKKKPQRKPTKVDAAEKKRRDWEIHNDLISEAFFTSILKNKKFPTYQSIANQLDLDVKTVQRHLKDDEMFEDLKVKLNALKSKALLTLAMKAIKGDSHHWTRLFFEVTEEVKGKDNNITIFINGKPAGAGS
jgi:hypothetical protein